MTSSSNPTLTVRLDASEHARRWSLVWSDTGETMLGGLVSYARAVELANELDPRPNVEAMHRARVIARADVHGRAAARPRAHYAGAREHVQTRATLDALARIHGGGREASMRRHPAGAFWSPGSWRGEG